MAKEVDGVMYYIVSEVGEKIDRSARTITTWYLYAEQENRLDELPIYYTDIGRKGTRYFTQEGIDKLIKFKENIVYGEMASINRTKWGEQGRRIMKEKTGLDHMRKKKAQESK